MTTEIERLTDEQRAEEIKLREGLIRIIDITLDELYKRRTLLLAWKVNTTNQLVLLRGVASAAKLCFQCYQPEGQHKEDCPVAEFDRMQAEEAAKKAGTK